MPQETRDEMRRKLNIATGIFDENENGGIMLCGYEWGNGYGSRNQQEAQDSDDHGEKKEPTCTFVESAEKKPFQNRVIKWFNSWGHPIEEGSAFDRILVHTNWCDTSGDRVKDWSIFLSEKQIKNFLLHIRFFQPRLVMFFGVRLMDFLHNPKVLPYFEEIMGKVKTKRGEWTIDYGKRKSRVSYASFKSCDVIGLHHTSSYVTDAAIASLAEPIEPPAKLISKYIAEARALKGI